MFLIGIIQLYTGTASSGFNPLNQVYVFNEYEITREAIEVFLKF